MRNLGFLLAIGFCTDSVGLGQGEEFKETEEIAYASNDFRTQEFQNPALNSCCCL